MIYFSCPTCQKVAQASDDLAGTTVACPGCNQHMMVPSATATVPMPPPGELSAAVTPLPNPVRRQTSFPDGKIRFLCVGCGKRLRVPVAAVGSLTLCRRCGQRMLVPPPDPETPDPVAEPPDFAGLGELPRLPSQYYYVKDNQRHGPIYAHELKDLADTGRLLPTDLIWKKGMPRWTPAAKLRRLFRRPPASVPLPLPAEPPPLPAGPPVAPPPKTTASAGTALAAQRPVDPPAAPPPSAAKTVGKRPGEVPATLPAPVAPPPSARPAAPRPAPAATVSQPIAVHSEADRAIATAAETLRREPRNAAALVNRGMAFAEKGDYARAVADLSEAIRADPRSAQAYASRGVIHATLKSDYTQAIADLTRAIQCAPEEIVLFEFRCLFYRTLGDAVHAAEDERRMAELRPRATASSLVLGRMPPASLVAPLAHGRGERQPP